MYRCKVNRKQWIVRSVFAYRQALLAYPGPVLTRWPFRPQDRRSEAVERIVALSKEPAQPARRRATASSDLRLPDEKRDRQSLSTSLEHEQISPRALSKNANPRREYRCVDVPHQKFLKTTGNQICFNSSQGVSFTDSL
jgi:hypothetical protein